MATHKKHAVASRPARPVITNSTYKATGRKGLMQRYGMIGGFDTRSPLTAHLFATLETEESYVSVPLEGRSRATVIFNLKTKAERVKADLHYGVDESGKILHAWLTKKNGKSLQAAPSASANGSEIPV
jgi:hypothetical protein